MFKDCLIIMPFQLPWEWSADYQRQTAQELSRSNLVIAYMQENAHFILKWRKFKYPRERNVIFFTPRYVLPFRRFAAIDKLNQLLNVLFISWWYGRGRKRVILWIFDPMFWFYPFLRRLFPRVISLYDCVDYVWSRDPIMRSLIQTMERALIQNVDFFFVNSSVLACIHSFKRKPDAIVPQGFRIDDFRKQHNASVMFPKDKKIIGYIGAIDHRLDLDLLRALIRNNPQWRFVLWGTIQEIEEADRVVTEQNVQHLAPFLNVTIGESKSRQDAPTIIRQFDAAIIPYDVRQEGVRHCYPMKLFEYFYMGKPVVSAPIEELKRFPTYVKVGRTAKDWEQHIKDLLSRPWPRRYQKEQRRLAEQNSWERKVEAIGFRINLTKDK